MTIEASIIGSFTLTKCECCGATGDISRPSSMTMYVTDLPLDHPENPNLPPLLCHEHRDEYRSYWQAMWDEYNAGRL